ncbi:MAG: hypothetical protein IJ047_07765 [Paludibacteraceae bacterium]|nr:hypothetical protein [Paludibacteraceae bacterium]
MAVRIISTKDFAKPLKVTLQSSGKLGFTAETAKALRLESGKLIQFGKDEEKNELYLILSNGAPEDAFAVAKAGDYFYLPTTLMFDSLEYNYKRATYFFDLVRRKEMDAELNGEVYYMKERMKYKKSKQEEEILIKS